MKFHRLRHRSLICILFAIPSVLILSMILRPDQALKAARDALLLCADVLIPSLFPFFVFSSLFIQFGFASYASRPCRFLMRPLFGINGAGSLAFILGFLSGYPLGAACTCELYQNHDIDKDEAERLLAFCNNSGPLFIIGAVGTAMYHNQQIGLMLYLIHILAAITVGVLMRIFVRKNSHRKSAAARPHIQVCHIGESITVSMRKSIQNILLVCGFTVVFAVVINTVTSFISDGPLSCLTAGLFEITTGLTRTSQANLSIMVKLIFTSAILGFAGISVHLQVVGIVSQTDLKLHKYFFGKFLQAGLAALYTAVLLALIEPAAPAIAQPVYLMPMLPMDAKAAWAMSLLYIASTALVLVILGIMQLICDLCEKHTKNRK